MNVTAVDVPHANARGAHAHSAAAAAGGTKPPSPLRRVRFAVDEHEHEHGHERRHGHGLGHGLGLGLGLGHAVADGRAEGATAAAAAAAAQRAATVSRSLTAAIALCLVFFAVELAAGLLSGSLAILSDAFHLLSDVAGFAVSVYALSLGARGATRQFSFGYKRVEVLGALMSTLLIWAITAVLVVEAVQRLLAPAPINAPMMFWTALFGVCVNIALAGTLHSGATAHHNHHGCMTGNSNSDRIHTHTPAHEREHEHEHEHQHSHEHIHPREHVHGERTPLLEHGGADIEEGLSASVAAARRKKSWFAFLDVEAMDMNARAAVLHVVSDLVSSVGVLVAATVLLVQPSWTFVDPICTFVFSILVFMSSVGLVQRCMVILMEGTPPSIDTANVESRLSSIPGVLRVESLHVWSISQLSLAATVRLVVERRRGKLSDLSKIGPSNVGSSNFGSSNVGPSNVVPSNVGQEVVGSAVGSAVECAEDVKRVVSAAREVLVGQFGIERVAVEVGV